MMTTSNKPMRCPACGATDSKLTGVNFTQGNRGKRQWLHCLNCDGYFDPTVYDETTEISHTQQQAWGQLESGTGLNEFKHLMYDAALRLLKDNRPPPASLLDVGCSFGGFMSEAKKNGYNVTGYDIVPEAVNYVKAQGLSAIQCVSLNDYATHESHSTLDVITCLDVNCYWPDQPNELAAAANLLGSGGVLLMRAVDKSWMFAIGLYISRVWPKVGEKVMRQAVNDHRHSMPIKSLLQLLRSNGFDIIYAAPKGAVHSERTRLIVRLNFAIGQIIWRFTGRFLAPGALILARKR